MPYDSLTATYDYSDTPEPAQIQRACGCYLKDPFSGATNAAANAFRADFASTSCQKCLRAEREKRQRTKSR